MFKYNSIWILLQVIYIHWKNFTKKYLSKLNCFLLKEAVCTKISTVIQNDTAIN
jgi:hypothetical protein